MLGILSGTGDVARKSESSHPLFAANAIEVFHSDFNGSSTSCRLPRLSK